MSIKNLEEEENKISVLLIYGSPRRNGNTDGLMNKFEEGLLVNKKITRDLLSIEKVFVRDLKFSPCIECRHCSTDGVCAIKDEMQEVYDKLINCDFLAVSSPVFFTSVSGYLKSFIDRCQKFWALKYELKKRVIQKDRMGIFVSTAGSGSDTIFDCSRKAIRSLFDVLYVKYDRDFVFKNIDFKGDIHKIPKALEEVYEYAVNLIVK
jgi:multimeric flavodoxin WrbA